MPVSLRALVRLLAACAVLLSLACPVRAEVFGLDDFRQSVDEVQGRLESIERALAAGRDGRALLEDRDRIRAVRDLHSDKRAALERQRDALRADLERLGPEPAKDQPAESPEIAAERSRITADLLELEAVLRKAALNDALAVRLLDSVADARREAFYERLLESEGSPLDPAIVSAAASSFANGLERSVRYVSARYDAWRQRDDFQHRLVLLAASLVLALVVLFPMRAALVGVVTRQMRRLEPTGPRAAIAAALNTTARLLAWGLGTGLIFVALLHGGVIELESVPVARTVWLWLVVILTVNAATTSIFLAEVPGWQLVSSDLRRRVAVRSLMVGAAVILALDAVFRVLAPLLRTTRELSLMQSALVAVLLAVLMWVLTRRRTWFAPAPPEPEPEAEADPAVVLPPGAADEGAAGAGDRWLSWRTLRGAALVLSISILAVTLAGQVALGYFAATRAFYLAGLVAAAWCLRALVQEVLVSIDEQMARHRALHGRGGRGSLLTFYFGVGIDLLLLLVVLPPAAIVLGADPSDVSNFVRDAFTGVQIGTVRVSIGQILSAVAAFLIVLGVTWLIQRILDRRMFPHMRVDIGVRHSFRTLVGYVGVFLAVLAAVGSLGVNLSNLAIVAGALSVGIGFGLQSIVNNFVSGLILLFERPIKIGDWIVTSSGEGYVRKISVRSTEIETFDRAAIIVPNSDLIGHAVTNRTHGNNIGRITVPVRVALDADPRRVMALLEGVVHANDRVMRYPAPFVYFSGFGPSSLDFELRAYLRDINEILHVMTELRIATFEALRDAGIRIPHPRQTVHLASDGEAGAPAAGRPEGTR